MTTTSESVYVWTWLPGAAEPVVAGRLSRRNDVLQFGYARSYLKRSEAISLGPELPLDGGTQPLRDGLRMSLCLRDGAPDSWGWPSILDQLAHQRGVNANIDDLDEPTYRLHSNSDRLAAKGD